MGLAVSAFHGVMGRLGYNDWSPGREASHEAKILVNFHARLSAFWPMHDHALPENRPLNAHKAPNTNEKQGRDRRPSTSL